MNRFLLFALASLIAASADAAVVYLRGGSTVSGTLIESGAREVVIQTPQGIQRIPVERIDHVDYGGGETAPAPAPRPSYNAPAETPEGYPPEAPERYVRRIPSEREEPRQTISFLAGVAVPIGNLDLSDAGGTTQRNGEWGPMLGIQYMYRTAPSFGLGLEADWAHRSIDDSVSSIPNAETLVWGDSGLFLGFFKAYLTHRGGARPYLLGGGGAARTSTRLDVTPAPGFVWQDTGTGETRRAIDDAYWTWASTARVGVDFFSREPSTFGLEVGWTRVGRHTLRATGAGQGLGLTTLRASIDTVTVTGRWGFSFGGDEP